MRLAVVVLAGRRRGGGSEGSSSTGRQSPPVISLPRRFRVRVVAGTLVSMRPPAPRLGLGGWRAAAPMGDHVTKAREGEGEGREGRGPRQNPARASPPFLSKPLQKSAGVVLRFVGNTSQPTNQQAPPPPPTITMRFATRSQTRTTASSSSAAAAPVVVACASPLRPRAMVRDTRARGLDAHTHRAGRLGGATRARAHERQPRRRGGRATRRRARPSTAGDGSAAPLSSSERPPSSSSSPPCTPS